MTFRLFKFLTIFVLLLVVYSCEYTSDCNLSDPIEFNEDSAYLYIKKQVDFGSRVPNSTAHDSCAIYLENKLKSFGANVIVQNANVKRFDGENLAISNIIGQFYPEKKRRVLLFAHWDSRYFADLEEDKERVFEPILGANDGASGVGVLMEIGRQISINEPNIGVDIIFFDAEDQGQPIYLDIYDEKAWCLGTQYWAENPHVEDYDALYGVSLDMVGRKDAFFAREDNSRYFNNSVVKKTWEIAEHLGHEKYFVGDMTRQILHDHVFVSQMAGIRSIMIIDNQWRQEEGSPYFKGWHTHNDNMDVIDKNTLNAVGETVLALLYCEK